jgi:SPOR domain
MVHMLWFRREGLDEADIFIGPYSSEEQAKAAIERLRHKQGFVDFPQGFEINPYELDHDHWEEGFKFDV